MKFIDLTIPLGIGTPPWPTYEPLQVKYFKRLAPNGANGQVVTHSNHVGTHLDGEIHFYTPGKDIAELDFDFLTGDAAIVSSANPVCSRSTGFIPSCRANNVWSGHQFSGAHAAVAVQWTCSLQLGRVGRTAWHRFIPGWTESAHVVVNGHRRYLCERLQLALFSFR